MEFKTKNKEVIHEKEFYREEIIQILDEIGTKRGEILYRITSIIEILPICECKRVLDYLSELYFS